MLLLLLLFSLLFTNVLPLPLLLDAGVLSVVLSVGLVGAFDDSSGGGGDGDCGGGGGAPLATGGAPVETNRQSKCCKSVKLATR